MGVYANSPPCCVAMAAVKSVYLAVIDTDKLHDRVTVFPPQTCTTSYHGWSWAEEIVPKLQVYSNRQQGSWQVGGAIM